MKNVIHPSFVLFFALISICSSTSRSAAQTTGLTANSSSDFWKRVQIGGGLGVGFGSGYTDITVAPGAIYNFNSYFAAGIGLSGTYTNYRRFSDTIDRYESYIYGGSLVGLFNPIPQIQLSAEVEELRVNTTLNTILDGKQNDDFWNTGLFFGAGFRTQNVTIGFRYNVLFDTDKTVYGDALMPFIRVYF